MSRMAEPKSPAADERTETRRPHWLLHGGLWGLLLVVACPWVDLGFHSVRSRPMSSCRRNLRTIGLAIQHYHYEYDCFPPPFVENDEGRRMHSWRALILPHLADLHEHDADWLKKHRYDCGWWEAGDFKTREKIARTKAEQIRDVLAAYDFSQPWDGPNNRRLADQALDAFCCHHGGSHSTTDYLAVVGSQTAWPEQGTIRDEDFHDGLSNTIHVVEAFGSEVRWSEPRDLRFDSMSFVINDAVVAGIKGPFPEAAFVLRADGGVRSISTDVDSASVKALLTINGQEQGVDW